MYRVQFLHENIVISQQSHYFTWFASLPLVQLYLVEAVVRAESRLDWIAA